MNLHLILMHTHPTTATDPTPNTMGGGGGKVWGLFGESGAAALRGYKYVGVDHSLTYK